MKRNYIILGFILLSCAATLAYEKVYLQKSLNPSAYNNYYYNRAPWGYNSYNNYYSPYRYQGINSYDAKRLRRVRTLRRINRNLYNFLTWDNPKSKGTLTGYSVPVKDDVYEQMGVSPYDPKGKKKTTSPTCNTDLFSSPTGDEMYYSNGERRRNLGGTQGKTGVTIIYD